MANTILKKKKICTYKVLKKYSNQDSVILIKEDTKKKKEYMNSSNRSV